MDPQDLSVAPLTRHGWKKFFTWLRERFAAKQDKLTAGTGIKIENKTITNTLPITLVSFSAMTEMINNDTWERQHVYFCIEDSDPSIWTIFLNGSGSALWPDEWYDTLNAQSQG